MRLLFPGAVGGWGNLVSRWNCVKTGQTGIRKDAASVGRIGGQKQQPSKQGELQAVTVIETWPNTDLGAIALP